jgi:hypothetical protein
MLWCLSVFGFDSGGLIVLLVEDRRQRIEDRE